MRTLIRCSLLLSTAAVALSAPVDFNRDIRPIMSDTCFFCHGPDKAKREAGLRLDHREEAIADRDGIRAIVPGKPEVSDAIERLFSNDPDEMMPPPDSNKKLTPAQKELIKRWVAEGAVYQPHWSYMTPQRPVPPTIHDAKYTVENPIDAFISVRLLEKTIVPSGEADRRTLLRRLSLDLTGLPPTPSELATFLADHTPFAYARQVERLLASPHYGERMAVPWLDAVRFSDTVGYHGDQNQRIFPYRDYVIKAFNKNLPFDQFTREQLAGDLLPNPTPEQLVATGFNRLNMMTREGGAQPKEYLAKYAADRVRTVSGAWMGSTLACSECHDHKFDPFSAKDFYQLAAFFADVKQWGVYSDYGYTPNPDLKGWSNEHPFPPEIEISSPYLQARKAKFEEQLSTHLTETRKRLFGDPEKRAEFERWREQARGFLAGRPEGWRPVAPRIESPKELVPKKTENAKSKTEPAPDTKPKPEGIYVEQDDVVRFRRLPERGEKYRVLLDPGPMQIAGVRAELAPGDQAASGLPNGGQRGGLKLAFAVQSADGKDRAVNVYRAEATAREPKYSNGAEVIGVQSGWKFSAEHANQKAASVWMFDPPLKLSHDERIVVTFEGDSVVPVKLGISPFGAMDPLAVVDEQLRKAVARNTNDVLADRYLWSTAWDSQAFSEIKRLQQEILECRDGKSWTMVTEALSEPLSTRVLARGNWQDENGEVVQPGVPHFLPQPTRCEDQRLTRLDLANWLCSPENPLTARVFMNRMWKQFFGNAISAQVEDLGAQGEWPSHPELLDWLAVEFRESGWDVKHMVRLIVTSAAYRRDSNLRRELLDVDPDNRLVATQNPRRLEAEFVRDNALSIAGLLKLEIGGPSAFPYQPPRYYEAIQFPDRDYYPSRDERQYRRGLYAHWQRTFLHPMMANFDAPSRDEGVCSRTNANTPQQALTLLNDPTFVEAARVLATNILRDPNVPTDSGRLESLFARSLARAPKDRERESLLKFLELQRQEYVAQRDDPAKLLKVGLSPAPVDIPPTEIAAWTSVCRVVLNLHETITRY
ncbi:MAG TPA: PSD1 and planctomycete cytochrome C domain-containing protein [Chthoniobacteraceae bacterium]|nr:PSD1 and planctomycete cytochrome C domain-containing protein [Chthoniobacteraceae bacterium]